MSFGRDSRQIIMFECVEYEEGGKTVKKFVPVPVDVWYIREKVLKTVRGRFRKKVTEFKSDYKIFDYLKHDSLLLMYPKNGKLIPLADKIESLMEYDDVVTMVTTPLVEQIKYLKAMINDMYKKKADEAVEITQWVEGIYESVTNLRKVASLAVARRFDLLTLELGSKVTQNNVKYILEDIANAIQSQLPKPAPLASASSSEPLESSFFSPQPEIIDVVDSDSTPESVEEENPFIIGAKAKPKVEVPKGIPKKLRKKVQQQMQEELNQNSKKKGKSKPDKLDDEGLDKIMEDLWNGNLVVQRD